MPDLHHQVDLPFEHDVDEGIGLTFPEQELAHADLDDLGRIDNLCDLLLGEILAEDGSCELVGNRLSGIRKRHSVLVDRVADSFSIGRAVFKQMVSDRPRIFEEAAGRKPRRHLLFEN